MPLNIILENGHGGMIKGVYQTAGKRSPVWPDGRQLFEGVFNRNIVNKLHKLCEFHAIDSTILVPEQTDISLAERCKRANKIYSTRKDSILISIHADAFNLESANGHTFFTSPGQTKSDKIAETLQREYANSLPEIRQRVDMRDGDHDKEANFYMLTQTNCPAVLIETGFMTNKSDCEFLFEEDRIVEALFNGILALRDELNKN